MIVEVFGLLARRRVTFVGITPREAVIAAYAQSLGDWNTWDYDTRYRHLVRINKGSRTIACGKDTNVWSALA